MDGLMCSYYIQHGGDVFSADVILKKQSFILHRRSKRSWNFFLSINPLRVIVCSGLTILSSSSKTPQVEY